MHVMTVISVVFLCMCIKGFLQDMKVFSLVLNLYVLHSAIASHGYRDNV